MKKNCSKCTAVFECKVDDVINCHCSSVELSKETLTLLNKTFANCLCPTCLAEYASDHS